MRDRHFHLDPHPDHPDDLHSLRVQRVEDSYYICTNNRCFGLDRHMAQQLWNALEMVLGGAYDLATTETFDRLELEKQRAASLIDSLPHRQLPPATPELDDL